MPEVTQFRVVLFALLLSICSRRGVAAQADRSSPRLDAVNAVIEFRMNWMRDTTKFDACSVYRAVGSQQEVASGLLPAFRNVLLARSTPCDQPENIDPRHEVRVLVDSLVLSDTTGRAFLTVRRGEQRHQEEYELGNPRAGWTVKRAILSGATRFYYVRPRPAASPSP